MTEKSVVTPTVFTGQYLPVAKGGSMKLMGLQIGEDQRAFTCYWIDSNT